MKIIDVINIIALMLSPVIAVWIGQYLQNRKKKNDSKMSLFLVLLSHRAGKISPDFVNALNLIDVIFYDNPKVIQAWHKHFDNLYKKDAVDLEKIRQRSFLDLVQTISIALGYKRLRQTDVDKVYFPLAHGERAEFDQNLKEQLIGFLKGGNSFFEFLKMDVVREQEEAAAKMNTPK